MVESWEGQLLFVYLPEWRSLKDPKWSAPGREEVLRATAELGIATLDLCATMRSHEDPLSLFSFRIHGHFNEKGYRLAANEVAEKISKAPNLASGEDQR